MQKNGYKLYVSGKVFCMQERKRLYAQLNYVDTFIQQNENLFVELLAVHYKGHGLLP